MKYIAIAFLSSPLLLAYKLRPTEMQEVLAQALHFVLRQFTS